MCGRGEIIYENQLLIWDFWFDKQGSKLSLQFKFLGCICAELDDTTFTVKNNTWHQHNYYTLTAVLPDWNWEEHSTHPENILSGALLTCLLSTKQN